MNALLLGVALGVVVGISWGVGYYMGIKSVVDGVKKELHD